MKVHLGWIGVVTAAVAAACVSPAAGQYAPYQPLPSAASMPTATHPAPPVPQSAYSAPWPATSNEAPPPAAAPVQAPVAGQYPQTATPAATPWSAPTAAAYPQVATRYPATPNASGPLSPYPSVARQPSEALSTPENATTDEAAGGGANGHTYPAGDYYYGEPPAHGYGGAVHGYHSTGHPDYGLKNWFSDGCYEPQVFGGVYWLFMQRDRQSPVKLTAEVDHATAPDPYYPPASATLMVTPDRDFRSGVEVRFGSTFTLGGWYDDGWGDFGPTRRWGPCAPQVWAWEIGWWGLEHDAQQTTVFEQFNRRIYGMQNFVGLQYNYDGVDWRPVNDFYGYGLPIDAPPDPMIDGHVRVLAQRVRTDFKAQNLELNVFRFPVACAGPCGPGYAAGIAACDPHYCPPAFSAYGSFGVRYFRADEDFMFASEFTTWDGGAWDQPNFNGFTYDNGNELFYKVQVENHLIGPQVGWMMNYCYSRFNFFLHSTFGIFHNRIYHDQRMFTGGDGWVRFAEGGEDFDVRSRKNDVSFLGELRAGAAYDVTHFCRVVAAYRAVAITGVATATDQIPSDFTNRDWVALIDSSSSMVVHGVQAGIECRY